MESVKSARSEICDRQGTQGKESTKLYEKRKEELEKRSKGKGKQ